MRFVMFLAAASVACAEPILSRVEILASHGTVRVIFQNSERAPAFAWIDYGKTGSLGSSSPRVSRTSTDANPTRTVIESALDPATRYFFRPMVMGASGTSKWRCTEGGVGWTCDMQSGLGTFVTADLPQEHPTPPAGVQPVDTSMPAINGETFSVTVNPNNQCVNFDQQIRACSSADPSLNHQIVIPAGASCTGVFTLPAKLGPGTCVIRTSTPDNQLPPEGVRIDPSYIRRMASIVVPASRTAQADDQAAINTVRCSSPICTQGWRFVGIEFAVEDLRTAKAQSVRIESIGTDGVITTVEPHGLSIYAQIYVSEVEGYDGVGPNGVFRAIPLSPTTMKLDYVYVPPIFTCASPPCYKQGTGRIMRAFVTPIVAASNATPVVLKTAEPHGLTNHPKYPVLAASNGVITVPEGHRLPYGNRTIKIEGSSSSEWNGYWRVLSGTATTLTLANAPKTSCSANCGAANMREILQVADVEGNTAANGAHPFTVLSPTEIKLDEASGNGDYASGGFVAFDPDLHFNIVTLGYGSDRIVIDRCFVNGRGFPNRVFTAVAFRSTNSGIVDSYIDKANGWRSVDPVTGVVQGGLAGLGVAHGVALDITYGSNKKIHNNFISAEGVTIFSQEGSGPVPENIQITRNRIYSDPKYMAGSPVSDGRYYPKRHNLEFKRGRRVLIDGNIIDGNWSDFTPCGPALALSIRGPARDNVTSDFTITNNIFRNTASGIQLSGMDDSFTSVTLPTSRIRIHNNLFHDIDYRAWQSKPSETGGGICGYAIGALWTVEDLTITNNTVADVRGIQPQFFTYYYGRGEGVVVRNNVFTHNHENGTGAIQYAEALNLPGMAPPITGTPAQAWKQYFGNLSDFSGNVVVPGVRKTDTSTNLNLVAAAINFTRGDCESYYAGFRDIICAGSGSAGETAAQRAASVFENPANKDFHVRNFPNKGADLEAIARATGMSRDNAVDSIGPNDAFIRYFASFADPCAFDYTIDPEGDCERVWDTGGEGLRTVALSNLRPASDYYYRVQCPSEQLVGHFQTLP